MTESPLPEAALEGKPRNRFGLRLSIAWVVPLIALLIALSIAWRTYSERGPVIHIVFDNGSGITAGSTLVKFKDFTIGVVEKIELSENLQSVVADVRLQADAAKWIDDRASFWLVTAQVGPQGISGLSTVLSGAYIEAEFDDTVGQPKTRFIALDEPPLTPLGQAGLRIKLSAPEGGSVSIGAPVLYKKIPVGKVEKVSLTDQGDVLVTAFIDAPYDNRVTSATHFWNASGFNIQLSTAGASLNVDSLASLVQGGISFDTVTSGGEPVENDHEFRLYSGEQDARVVLLNEDPADNVTVMAFFDGSIKGLNVESPVEYRGIPVGKVTEIQAEVIRVNNEPVVRVRAAMSLVPSRFGVRIDDSTPEAAYELLATSVNRGMRAQLRSSNFLTGSLAIALVEETDAPPATFDVDAKPWPEIPSIPSSGGGIADTAQDVMARIDDLPIEEIMSNVNSLLANVNILLTSDAVQAAPENIGLLIADLRTFVSDSGLEEIPPEITGILAGIRTIIDDLNEQDMAAKLGAAADGLPELMSQIDGILGDVRELPLDQTVTSVNDLIGSLETYIQSDEMKALPVSAEAVIGDLRQILQDIRDGGATENINAAIASASRMMTDLEQQQFATTLGSALEDARAAIQSVTVTADGLPAVLAEVQTITGKISDLPLDQLVASATNLVNSVDAVVKSDDVAALPGEVNMAVAEVRQILEDLRTGGAADNINASLASLRSISEELATSQITESLNLVLADVRTAVGNVNNATADLPELLDSLNQLSTEAANLPLEELVASSSRVLNSADLLMANPGMQDIPPQLAASLEQFSLLLAELREGGAVENLNATLASADRAADSVANAADELPALINRLSAATARADATLGSVGPGSELNRETLATINELRSAARAVNALVTALERRPNSVLFGR